MLNLLPTNYKGENTKPLKVQVAVDTETINHIYYSVSIRNPLGNKTDLPLTFSEFRNNPLMENPSEWLLSVERLVVPSDNIELFSFQEGEYKVTIDNTTQVVTFGGIPNNNEYFTPLIFINDVNIALELAHAGAGGAPGEEPFFYYEPETNLISLYVINTYTFDIYLNYPLNFFFKRFDIDFLATGDLTIDKAFKYNYYNNYSLNVVSIQPPPLGVPTEFYKMTQAFPGIANWSEARKIIITSHTLNTQKEYLAVNNNNGNDEQIASLEDFSIPPASGEAFTTPIEFNATLRRYREITGRQPLRSIDLQFYVEDILGELKLLKIAPGTEASIKLLFKRKSVIDNN